jgi:sialate O-acetylesterase
MRLAQLKTAQTISKVALTVNIDLGEWNDIHPQNKKDVGKRMALAAEQLAYNEKMVASGPIFRSAKVVKNQIELSFSSCGSGLATRDGKELKGFAISGADQKYVWAKAEIKGSKILVWSEKVSTPAFVRYAWADNPAGANLINKEGLPASPFSTK